MRITPVPPGTLVVGIDGAGSHQALVWAVAEATRTRTDLTLVHGIGPDGDGYGGLGPVDLRVAVDGDVLAGQGALDRARAAVRELAPHVRVRQVLRLAGPRCALMDLAAGAKLVVIGERRGEAGESTTRYLLTQAPCPVVVVRPGADRAPVLQLAG